MLNIIFGINGVGKDAVGQILKQQGFSVTSWTRIALWSIKALDSYDGNEFIEQEKYELLSQKENVQIIDQVFDEKLLEIANSKQEVLLLAHLVIIKDDKGVIEYHPNKEFLDRFVPLSDWLFYLTAEPEEILARRLKDESFRNRLLDLDQVIRHQHQADIVWNSLGKPKKGKRVICNNDLAEATSEISTLLY